MYGPCVPQRRWASRGLKSLQCRVDGLSLSFFRSSGDTISVPPVAGRWEWQVEVLFVSVATLVYLSFSLSLSSTWCIHDRILHPGPWQRRGLRVSPLYHHQQHSPHLNRLTQRIRPSVGAQEHLWTAASNSQEEHCASLTDQPYPVKSQRNKTSSIASSNSRFLGSRWFVWCYEAAPNLFVSVSSKVQFRSFILKEFVASSMSERPIRAFLSEVHSG